MPMVNTLAFALNLRLICICLNCKKLQVAPRELKKVSAVAADGRRADAKVVNKQDIDDDYDDNHYGWHK